MERTLSFVTICEKVTDKKAQQIIFYLVFIFKFITNKFSQNFIDIIQIKKKASFDF